MFLCILPWLVHPSSFYPLECKLQGNKIPKPVAIPKWQKIHARLVFIISCRYNFYTRETFRYVKMWIRKLNYQTHIKTEESISSFIACFFTHYQVWSKPCRVYPCDSQQPYAFVVQNIHTDSFRALWCGSHLHSTNATSENDGPALSWIRFDGALETESKQTLCRSLNSHLQHFAPGEGRCSFSSFTWGKAPFFAFLL